jgi:hypothetical protein
MPISRGQMPRQMYGLGSLVKSIGKTVKKIVKSPIGKAAILGFGANALMPGGLAGFFGKGSLNPLKALSIGGDIMQSPFGSMLSGAKNFLGDKLAGKAGILGAGALAGIFASQGISGEQAEEIKRNPAALRSYLSQYYKNLNKNASDQEVNEFVEANMAEYKADGGRIGYDDGTDPKKEYLIKKGYGDMVENMSVIEIDELFNSVKGTTTAANTYREPAYMGGRMGYENGTEEIVQPSASMMVDTTTSNPIPDDAPQKEISEVAKIMLGPGRSGIGEPEDGTMKGYQFFREKYLPKKVTEIAENYGIEENEVLRMIRDEMMQYIDAPKSLEKPEMANGGRMGFAMGNPEENAVQASGIMDLPLNQNPAGITELDLRETGGFIPPVGVKEKADDIPAMLSNNEFVFTADAVRGMGDGNVNKGAQRMYDMMKKLEKGGRV